VRTFEKNYAGYRLHTLVRAVYLFWRGCFLFFLQNNVLTRGLPFLEVKIFFCEKNYFLAFDSLLGPAEFFGPPFPFFLPLSFFFLSSEPRAGVAP